MDIVEHYLSRNNHSERTQHIAEDSYQQLQNSRIDALKVVVPATALLILSSLRQRKPKQIVAISALFLLGSVAANELASWNKLSGRLYIAMKSTPPQFHNRDKRNHSAILFCMYEKQILTSQLPTIAQQPPPSPSSSKHLMQMWFSTGINDSYQAIVLQYLDRLPALNQWTQIEKEIRKTNEKNTHFHSIDKLLAERDNNVQNLKGEVRQLQQWSSKVNKRYPYMESICDLIDQVRKLSMLICEEVTGMFGYFKYDPQKNPSLGSYYLQVFRAFDESLHFLRKSQLAYYISFSDSYDPLLVETLKRMGLKQESKPRIYDENVAQLFHLNASYLYRLLRSHQKMSRYFNLSLNSNRSSDPEPLQHYARHYSHKPQQFNRQPFREGVSLPKKYRDSEERPYFESKSREKVESKNSKIDRRRIFHCQPVTIFQNKNRFNHQALSRLTRNTQDISEDQHDRYSPQHYKFHLSTENTNKTLQRYGIKQIPNYRSRTIEEQHFRKTPETNKRSNSFAHKRTQSKATNSINLPNRSKLGRSLEEEELSRHIHRDHTHNSYENIAESDYEETRKSIINSIKQKYKAMAKKEIRYELSKLGDHTYHRMRSKILRKNNNAQNSSHIRAI